MSLIVKSVMWACVMVSRCSAAEDDVVSMLQARAELVASEIEPTRPPTGWAKPVKPTANKGNPEPVEESLDHVSTAITDADEMDVDMTDVPEDPDPVIVEHECSESNWVVQFYLAGQHTYFEVPTCTKVSKQFPGPVQPVPWKCGKCATDGEGGLGNFKMKARVNWNTKGCRGTGLCYNATKKAALTGTRIGDQDGLKVHPICAWGILDLLDDVYVAPFRGPTNTAGPMMTQKWDPINTPKGQLSLMKAEKMGGQAAAVRLAATLINWDRHLSGECKPGDFRTEEQILKKAKAGAVCWNNVQDFRDLVCNYKQKLDVTDHVQCRAAFGPNFELTRR